MRFLSTDTSVAGPGCTQSSLRPLGGMKLFGGASHSFREPEAHDRVALTPRRHHPFPEPDPSTSLGAAARERPPRPDGAPLLQWLCGKGLYRRGVSATLS